MNDLKYIVVMRESSFIAVNLEEFDNAKTDSKIEKEPWPETITEEMEQSTLMRRIDSNTSHKTTTNGLLFCRRRRGRSDRR